jgi:hypothetical protein
MTTVVEWSVGTMTMTMTGRGKQRHTRGEDDREEARTTDDDGGVAQQTQDDAQTDRQMRLCSAATKMLTEDWTMTGR